MKKIVKTAHQKEVESIEKRIIGNIISKRLIKLKKNDNGKTAYTTAGLAARAGVAQSTASSLMHGEVEDARIYTIIKFCRARGITLSEFFRGFEAEMEHEGVNSNSSDDMQKNEKEG